MEHSKSPMKITTANVQAATCEAEALLEEADPAAEEVLREQASPSRSTADIANDNRKPAEHTSIDGTKATAPKREKDTQSASLDSEDVSVGRESSDDDGPDWELDSIMEELQTGGKDILEKIQYNKTLQVSLVPRNAEDPGKVVNFQLSVGDRVWILPDKQSLAIPSDCESPQDLPDKYWSVGEIINCCQIEDPAIESGSSMRFLEVVWLYTYEEALLLESVNLHRSWIDKIKKYELKENERILTDHRDFVSLSSLAGPANGIFAHLQIHGLAMSAADRLSDVRDRRKRGVTHYVWVDGFSKRDRGIESSWSEQAEKVAFTRMKAQSMDRVSKSAEKKRTAETRKKNKKRGRYNPNRDRDEAAEGRPVTRSSKKAKTSTV